MERKNERAESESWGNLRVKGERRNQEKRRKGGGEQR